MPGVSGLIVADLPREESGEVRAACAEHGVDYVNIVTPNTSEARMREILDGSSGFVYLVSTMGVTGKRKELSQSLRPVVDRAVKASGDTPVAVGFGISGPDHVREVIDMGADGAIVGSVIVDMIAKGASPDELRAFVRGLKQATRPMAAELSEKS